MNENITERLKWVLNLKNMNANHLTVVASLSQGLLNKAFKGKTGLNSETIEKILSAVPDLDAQWLITGKGMPLKADDDRQCENFRICDENTISVPIITRYNYSNFVLNIENENFLKDQPRIPFQIDDARRHNYLCFEVSNDSMYNGSSDSYKEGSIVLAEQTDAESLSKVDFRQWDFVIVHRSLGVIIKRIEGCTASTGKIKCSSLNPLYQNFDIQVNDILKIFCIVRSLEERKRK